MMSPLSAIVNVTSPFGTEMCWSCGLPGYGLPDRHLTFPDKSSLKNVHVPICRLIALVLKKPSQPISRLFASFHLVLTESLFTGNSMRRWLRDNLSWFPELSPVHLRATR